MPFVHRLEHGYRLPGACAGSRWWPCKAHTIVPTPSFRRRLPVIRASRPHAEHTSSALDPAEPSHRSADPAETGQATPSNPPVTNSQFQLQTPQTSPAATSAGSSSRPGPRELDVNRAIRLLKLTTQRSSKNTSKLPPWFTRTQDPDVWDGTEQSASYDAARSTASVSNGSATSSRQSAVQDTSVYEAGAPLDSYMALAEPDSKQQDAAANHSSVSSGSNSSRPGSPAAATASAVGSNLRSRMFSASDPVKSSSRRSSSPDGGPLLWQDFSSTDTAKEQERQFRRAVFSFDRWAAHRSTTRYLRHFRGIFSSRTFQGLLQPMSFFTGMAVACGLYNSYALPAGAPAIVISSTPLDITAFAVSLLLVFRTDSSYARWEEALKTWNEVRSLSKDLARQSCYWVNEPARKAMLVRWSEAFSRALLVHCRLDGDLEHELEDVLLPHEVAAVAAVGPSGAPSFVLQVLAELIEQCGVTETKEDTMFGIVRSLSDSVAVCNKLLRYPLPLAYTRHTSRFMFLWLSAMPWAMWSDMHWTCVPITAAIAYLLLGIDEIGVQIEEPFGILPLEDVCVDITAEIDAMMERQDIVTDLLAAGGVDCAPRSTCGECGQPVAAAAAAAAAAPLQAPASSSSSSSDPCGSSSSEPCGSSSRGITSVLVPAAPAGCYDNSRRVDQNGSSSSTSSSAVESAGHHHAGSSSSSPVACSSSSSSSDAAAAGDPQPPAAAQDLSSSSSSSSSVIGISSSATNGAGGITRISRSGSPQGLVARWVTSTITGSAELDLDPLSSLEDAIAPGFDVRGYALNDLPPGNKSAKVSTSMDGGSGSSSWGWLGRYKRQPAPKDDLSYPD